MWWILINVQTKKIISRLVTLMSSLYPNWAWVKCICCPFPISGRGTLRWRHVFMNPGTICWKKTDAWLARLLFVNWTVFSLPLFRATNGAACNSNIPQGAILDDGELPRSIKDFDLVSVSLTRRSARQQMLSSVAECWPQALFDLFLRYCPAASWRESSVHRIKSGAGRVSSSLQFFFF